MWKKFQNLKFWIKNEHDVGISVNFCNVDVVSCWLYEHNAFCEETFMLWSTISKDAEYTLQKNEWCHFFVRRQTYCWCGSTFVSEDRNTIDVAPFLCQKTDILLMWLHFCIRRTDILLMWLHSCVSRQKCSWCGSTFVSGDRCTVDVAPLSHQEDRHTVDVAILKTSEI